MKILVAALVAAAVSLAGCSSGGGSESSNTVHLDGFVGVDGAQKLVDQLNAHGIPTSTPQPSDAAFLRLIGGIAFDVDVNRDGFDDGINQFPNGDSLAKWVEASKSVSGIAVTGDTWAISLNSHKGRARSEQLAPKIAAALGGTVQG